MNVIQPLIKTKEELLFICPWWLLSYKSSDVDLTVNISLSCSLFQHLYLTMSEEAGDNEESAVNMQHNSQKIKHKAIPRFLDEILALPCLAMQSVFIDSSKISSVRKLLEWSTVAACTESWGAEWEWERANWTPAEDLSLLQFHL